MDIDLLRRLCETPGIAGYEDRVRAVVTDALRPLADDVRTDIMGNVIATRSGSGGPRVMLAAHTDEIGFLVRHIDERGFLRLQPVGSFDPRVLLAQRVTVHGRDGRAYTGAIQTTAEPLHVAPPAEPRRPALDDLYVDLGMAAARVHARIEIGCMVTLDRALATTEECVLGKSLDDRLGVYVMIEAIRAMGSSEAEIVAVATSQEEVGSRGAVPAAFAIEPDIAIALDLTIANDVPGSPGELITALGKGPAIKVMDTTQLSHPALVRRFREVAERHGIPYQLEVLNRGGTDASLIQRVRGGVAVVTLSIPARYIHTVNEMAHQDDIENSITLLARVLESLNAEWHRGITSDAGPARSGRKGGV